MEEEFTLPDGFPSKLTGLLAVWYTKRRGDRAPLRGDFSPRGLKPWLANLALLERASENEYRFRVCGSALIPRFGCDPTDQAVNDLDQEFRIDLQSRLDCATASQRPVSARFGMISALDTVDYSELILPLLVGGAGVGMLFLAAYPTPRAAYDHR
ncbi:MAG: PAS domain-containing protein [Alphaproteobacteria bacterium]|nr:PAS domain-containing protein [Alphaproteobacteria bacterium]